MNFANLDIEVRNGGQRLNLEFVGVRVDFLLTTPAETTPNYFANVGLIGMKFGVLGKNGE